MEPNFNIALNKAQRTDDSHYHKAGTAKTHNHVLYYSIAEHKVVELTDKHIQSSLHVLQPNEKQIPQIFVPHYVLTC